MPDSMPFSDADLGLGTTAAEEFRRLAGLGFLTGLLPIIPPDAMLSPRSGVTPDKLGKIPGKLRADGWVGFAEWTPYIATEADIAEWGRWPGVGIGLNSREAAAFDIDVTVATLAEEIESIIVSELGPSRRRVGNSPKRLLVYRVEKPIAKIRLVFSNGKPKGDPERIEHAIEVLGEGQQFVYWGTHPKTRRPYEWENTTATGESFKQWTLTTHDKIGATLAKITAHVTAKGWTVESDPKVDDAGEKAGRKAPAGFKPDQPHTIARVAQWLKHKAPAVEGEAGNPATVVVANKCGDQGLTEGSALAAMLQHWNERCSPPWEPDELAYVVASAYRSRQNEIGCDYVAPGEETFGDNPHLAGEEASAGPLLIPLPLDLKDTDLSPRRWVLGRVAIRGMVTMLIAPGGVGKSTLAQVIESILASGKNLLGDMFAVQERCVVAALHYEEEQEELYRRELATRLQYKLTAADLRIDGRPAVFLTGLAKDREPVRFAEYADGNVVATPAVGQLIAELIAAKAAVLVVDPLIAFHGVNENSNEDMDKVVRVIFGGIARQADVAVILLHHTNKPQGANSAGRQGEQHSSRGASAQTYGARFVLTLYAMTDKEAKEYAIPAGTRWRYFRLDRAKGNYSEGNSEPTWFEFKSVRLATSDPDKSESVGVPVAAALHRVRQATGKTLTLAQTILRAMEYMTVAGREPVLEAPAIEVARTIVTVIQPKAELSPEDKRHRMQEALAEAPIIAEGWLIEYVPGKNRHTPAMMRRSTWDGVEIEDEADPE